MAMQDGRAALSVQTVSICRGSCGSTSRWDEFNQSAVGLDRLASDFNGDGETDLFNSGRRT